MMPHMADQRNDQTSDQLIGVSMSANLLRVSTETVRRLAARGLLPMEMTPYGRAFLRRDVERLARERAGGEKE